MLDADISRQVLEEKNPDLLSLDLLRYIEKNLFLLVAKGR